MGAEEFHDLTIDALENGDLLASYEDISSSGKSVKSLERLSHSRLANVVNVANATLHKSECEIDLTQALIQHLHNSTNLVKYPNGSTNATGNSSVRWATLWKAYLLFADPAQRDGIGHIKYSYDAVFHRQALLPIRFFHHSSHNYTVGSLYEAKEVLAFRNPSYFDGDLRKLTLVTFDDLLLRMKNLAGYGENGSPMSRFFRKFDIRYCA
ncbi:hypothetical protein MHU86_1672 [Fragilaria crotonensis]|nr:hypothetical protein MHU86_1672 [Fragilaria crotonensis]